MIGDTGTARRCDHGSVGKASRTSSDGLLRYYLQYPGFLFFRFLIMFPFHIDLLTPAIPIPYCSKELLGTEDGTKSSC